MKVIFASNNLHKHRDMAAYLVKQPLNLISAEELVADSRLGTPPAPEEIHDTYLQNAQLKADAWRRWAGIAALADDSGLEVFALSGAPGVNSAFFAGKPGNDNANNEKLLRELSGIDDRRALFRCLLCLSLAEGEYLVSEGTLEGSITREPRGISGWGYEPLFEVAESGKTIAELRDEGVPLENHRSRAIHHLGAILRGL